MVNSAAVRLSACGLDEARLLLFVPVRTANAVPSKPWPGGCVYAPEIWCRQGASEPPQHPTSLVYLLWVAGRLRAGCVYMAPGDQFESWRI